MMFLAKGAAHSGADLIAQHFILRFVVADEEKFVAAIVAGKLLRDRAAGEEIPVSAVLDPYKRRCSNGLKGVSAILLQNRALLQDLRTGGGRVVDASPEKQRPSASVAPHDPPACVDALSA